MLKFDSSISVAAKYGQLEIVKHLINKGINIDSKNRHNYTPLILAIENNQYEVTKYLTNKGSCIQPSYTQFDKKEKTNTLGIACSIGNVDIIKLLIDKGHTINHDILFSAISFAAQRNKINSLKFFEKFINRGGYDFDTILIDPIIHNNIDVIEFFIDNGAKVDGQKSDGILLRTACKFGEKDIVDYLIKKGANVNAVDISGGLAGDSALMEAVYGGYLDITKILIENGANLEYQNESADNETAIITASCRGSRNILEFLIEKGANINFRDKKGNTALVQAVNNGQVDNIKVLLKYNADITIKNNNGQNALDVAKIRKNKDIIKLLKKFKH